MGWSHLLIYSALLATSTTTTTTTTYSTTTDTTTYTYVGSPITFMENGETHEQHMNMTMEDGTHVLSVHVPAHGDFQEMHMLMVAKDTEEIWNSYSLGHLVVKIGDHSVIMETVWPSLHELFVSAHIYNETITKKDENRSHIHLIHQERLLKEDVMKIHPSIHKFVGSGSISKVKAKVVSEEEFINNIEKKMIEVESTFFEHRSKRAMNLDLSNTCQEKKFIVTREKGHSCFRLIYSNEKIKIHNIVSLTEGEYVSCCDWPASIIGNEPQGDALQKCCQKKFPSICACDDPTFININNENEKRLDCGICPKDFKYTTKSTIGYDAYTEENIKDCMAKCNGDKDNCCGFAYNAETKNCQLLEKDYCLSSYENADYIGCTSKENKENGK